MPQLPNDVGSLPGPLAYLKFYKFVQPVPFSASIDEKSEAPIEFVRTGSLDDYPAGNEMCGLEIRFEGPFEMDSPVTIRVDFFDHYRSRHLWGGEMVMPTAQSQGHNYWNWYWWRWWIGHTYSEIREPMIIRAEVQMSGPDFWNGSATLFFEVTAAAPVVEFNGASVDPTHAALGDSIRLLISLQSGSAWSGSVNVKPRIEYADDDVSIIPTDSIHVSDAASTIAEFNFPVVHELPARVSFGVTRELDGGDEEVLLSVSDAGVQINTSEPPEDLPPWQFIINNFSNMLQSINVPLTQTGALMINHIYRLVTQTDVSPETPEELGAHGGFFNGANVILFGQDVEGNVRDTPTTQETIDFITGMIIIGGVTAALIRLGGAIINRVAPSVALPAVKKVMQTAGTQAITATQKRSFASMAKGALRAIYNDFKQRPLLSLLLGTFAISEIPTVFTMRQFARNQVAEYAGIAPDQVTFGLNTPDDNFRDLSFDLGAAINTGDKDSAQGILDQMAVQRDAFATYMQEKEQVLRDIDQWDIEQENLEYMNYIIEAAQVEINALTGAEGTLQVSSNIEASDVYVNGIKKGLTPFTMSLSPGSYNIIVTKFGYTSDETTVEIITDQTSTFDAVISLPGGGEDTGTLIIRSNVDASDVYINGVKRGLTPFELQMEPGEYHILVSKFGYTSDQKTVEVVLNETEVFVAEIQQDTGTPNTYISIDTVPWGCVVLLNGAVQQFRTPLLIEVQPGSHQVEVKKEGFIDQSFDVSLDEGQTYLISTVMVPIEPEPPEEVPPGAELWKVTFLTDPPGAKILINGSVAERAGFTIRTPDFIILGNGSYAITAQLAGFETPPEQTLTLPPP